MKHKSLLILLSALIVLALSACDTNPVVVVATPVPLDSSFHTYRHPSGVFSLRLPPDWSVRDVSSGDAVRVEFSPPGNAGARISIHDGAIVPAEAQQVEHSARHGRGRRRPRRLPRRRPAQAREGDRTMRRVIGVVMIVGVLAAACGGSNRSTQPTTGASGSSCTRSNLHLLHP